MTTTRNKIKKARELMFEVTKEQSKRCDTKIQNDKCKCGHMRKHHSVSYSINYSDGFCSKCGCKHFDMTN